jgi:Ca2+-binding RTX toxin-like protein
MNTKREATRQNRARLGRLGRLVASLCLLLPLAGLVPVVAKESVAHAYNVCTDDHDPCTHEVMTQQGLQLYKDSPGALPEIEAHWNDIKEGVGDPDQFDPLYGNGGVDDALVTITHFWDADTSLGAPMTFDLLSDDDYPNAFQAAQALWTRALGEYAAGNKSDAYRLLGQVAHFLGDQTIPTHVHNDTHGPDFLDYDAYEEWMSLPADGGGDSPKALLSEDEMGSLGGIQEIPAIVGPEPGNQLLWLFLATNQRADFFASDGGGFGNLQVDGDANHPSDPRVAGWVQGVLDEVRTACSSEPRGCPTTQRRLADNHGNESQLPFPLPPGWDPLPPDVDGVNDADLDLSLIRKHSYLPGIRNMGALFDLWERAIRQPVLTMTVHEIREIGDYEGDCGFLEVCSGMDSILEPDYYVGTAMGENTRSCAVRPNCEPAAAYLEDRRGGLRSINGAPFLSNTTRRLAFSRTEDKTRVLADYHFAQAYPQKFGSSTFERNVDTVRIPLAVWENDESIDVANAPYDSDDIADVHPAAGVSDLAIHVDLEQCRIGAEDAVTVAGSDGAYPCAPSTDPDDSFKITRQGTGDDTEDTRVVFSVTMSQADTDADGVPDATDNCPGTPNSSQEDLDQNGVGNACDAPILCSGRVATIVGTTGNDVLAGTPGNDVIVAGPGNDTITGSGGHDFMCGGDGADLIHGDGGDDWAFGDAGVDRLRGGVENDVLFGGAGADSLRGDAGIDAVIGGAGNDQLQGGDGPDQVQYFDAPNAVVVDLAAGTATGHGSDKLAGIERIVGSHSSDTLLGSTAPNEFIGLEGDDVIDGRGGRDAVHFNFRFDPVRVNLTTGVATGQGTDSLRSIEDVVGTINADHLVGSKADNHLIGLEGADVLEGQDGADRLQADPGNDLLRGGRGADLLDGGAGTDEGDGGAGLDTCSSIETVVDCS